MLPRHTAKKRRGVKGNKGERRGLTDWRKIRKY